MSRRVPEFAVVTGVFLGLSVLVSGVALGWSLYAIVVVAAAVAYPFVAFGVLRDDDPAATIRPRPVLAIGLAVAAAGAVGVLLDDPTPRGALFALLVAAVLAAPPAGYATRHGADVDPLPPRTTVAAGAAVGLAVVLAGLAVGAPYVGTAAGAVIGLGAALYGTSRGVAFAARTKRRAAALGAVLGVGIAALGVVNGGSVAEWVLVGAGVTVVPTLYAALSGGRTGAGR